MKIQSIDTEIVKAYFHSGQPDIPKKSASEMKEFFDVMPKKVLIPKLNEIIDELNGGGYGKSAYDIACEHGFSGDEAQWLASLVGKTGKTGPKGEKGADATIKCDDVSNIITEGIYLVDGEYYLASPKLWDTSLDVPFIFTGDSALVDKLGLDADDSMIPGAQNVPDKSTMWGVPLLKYNNTQGDGSGATYIILRWDNITLLVYTADLHDATPQYVCEYDLLSEEGINLSSLITEHYTFGTGEDISGNFAKINRYLKSGLDVLRIVTKKTEFTNVLKGKKTANAVLLDDLSPIEHELEVSVSGGTGVKQYGKNLLPYPYIDTTKTKNGVEFIDNGDGSVTVKGTATADTNFILSYYNYFGSGTINSISNVASNGQYVMSKYLYYSGESNPYLPVSIVVGKDKTIDETIYPQVAAGNVLPEYEQYKAPVEHTADENGKIKGLVVSGGSMTLKADPEALVSVEYNRDINKVIAKLEG